MFKRYIVLQLLGEGINRWLLSQKEFLEVIRPEEHMEEIKETIEKMLSNYQ